MNDHEQEYLDKQEAQNLRTQANQTALRAAAEHKQRTVHNENFLNELRKADLDPDDEAFDFAIEDEFSDWFSGAKAVTNRGDEAAGGLNLRLLLRQARPLLLRAPH